MLTPILLAATVLTVQLPDTLQSASIIAEKGYTVSRTDTVAISSEIELGEFLSSIPTLGINDNGGGAGLKSINFRGLGSAFTNIYVDGVKVNNLQSGQAHISFLDLNQFSTAKVDYAQNSLNLGSTRPQFTKGKFNTEAKISYGSFGTTAPSVKLNFRLSDAVTLRASAASLISKGDFKYGDGLTRTNNDIQRYNAGIDLWGRLHGGSWHAKAYASKAERGTAGAVNWPSDDRQKDLNIFIQSTLEKTFSECYSLSMSAKAAADRIDFLSTWGNSRYTQKEIQVNSSQLFTISRSFRASISSGLLWDDLESDIYSAGRTSLNVGAAAIYERGRFSTQLNYEYQAHFDRNHAARNVSSPALLMKYRLCDWLSISALSRRAFRMPSFNELYYKGYGNPELKPEDAWISDIGIQANKCIAEDWKLDFKLDFFYNELKDKIVSAPTQEDPNIWLPYNLATSSNRGFDANIAGSYSGESLKLRFTAAYSFQDSSIPYINRHNLNISTNASSKGWEAIMSWRLRAGRKDGSGPLPDWNSLDLRIARSLTFSRNSIKLYLSANNILDEGYESVRFYPMPGRSLTLGIIYNLK